MLGIRRILLLGFISLCLVHYISAGKNKTKTKTITKTKDGKSKRKEKTKTKNKNRRVTTTTSDGLRAGLEFPQIPECCVSIEGTGYPSFGPPDPIGPDFDQYGGGTSGEGNDNCPPGYELNITCTTNTTNTTTTTDVDEKGLNIANPVEDNTTSEAAPLPDDLVSSGAEEDGIASAETATNNSPPPGYDGSDSKADDTPAELKSLSDDENKIPEKAVLEGNTIDTGDGLTADRIEKSDTPSENKNEDALMVGRSNSFTKKYWYYPPAPVRCAGQLFDPIRYFCCSGKLYWKTFFYRYYWYSGVSYVDACCCGTPYNSQISFCCKDKVYSIEKIGRAGYIGCCNGQAYNKDKQLCCDGKLYNNEYGCSLQCCGSKAYSKTDALCCKDILIPRRGDTPMSCCGNNVFNPQTESCCGNCAIKKVSGQQCCGEGVYNTATEICCGGKAYSNSIYNSCCWNPPNGVGSRPYDSRNFVCCGNRVYRKIFGSNTTCCSCYMNGKYIAKIFNSGKSRCCGCRVYTMPDPSYKSCCCNYKYYYFNRYCPYFPYYYYFPRPYYYHHNYPTCRLINPSQHSCCNGNVFNKFGPYDRCCNTARYDRRYYICCNGQVRKRVSLMTTTCCGTEPYNYRKNTCCYNQVLRITDDKRSCCGYELYNYKTHKCCNGIVVPGGNNYICCGNRAWDGKLYGCCGNEPFYRPGWSCCNGKKVKGGGNDARCCGLKTYDIKTHMCCCRCIHPKRPSYKCCGSRTYNKDNQKCCHNTDTVVPSNQVCIAGS